MLHQLGVSECHFWTHLRSLKMGWHSLSKPKLLVLFFLRKEKRWFVWIITISCHIMIRYHLGFSVSTWVLPTLGVEPHLQLEGPRPPQILKFFCRIGEIYALIRFYKRFPPPLCLWVYDP